ncbi:MAG: FMN-binding protein [Treponema sp.]|nr:FMN-binding protein [Treponema sp.]
MNVKEMIKLGLILAVFATAACVMLAFVYSATAPIIAAREADTLKGDLSKVFPDPEANFKPTEIISPSRAVTISDAFMALHGEEVVGAVVSVSTQSFGGPMVFLIGVSDAKTITGVKITKHSDTPGFGANADSETYLAQFIEKSINDPFEVKGDVDSVASSTITSRAVALSVKTAGLAVAAWLDGEELVFDDGAEEEVTLESALAAFFPDADFESAVGITSPDDNVTIQNAFTARSGGQFAGAAASVSTKGFAGPVITLVGVSAEKMITGVRILDHSETPGLGAEAASPSFLDQFNGKNVSDPFEVHNDVDIVASSTVTSKAVAESVKAAGLAVAAWLSEIEEAGNE